MSANPGGLSLDSLAPVQLDRLVDAIESFPPLMRMRGGSYAAGSRVGPLVIRPDAIGARVRGSRLYDVWWNWEDGSWESSCSCPMGHDCKHQYAVLCCILEPLRHRDPFRQRLARRLPDRPATIARLLSRPDPHRRPAGGQRRTRSEAQVLEMNERPGPDDRDTSRFVARRQDPGTAPRPAAPGRPRGLKELRAARDSWSRTSALQQLLMERPRISIVLYASPFREILAEPDFDIMCWRLAQAIPIHTGGWIPTALEPYREREDLRERHAQRARQNLAARLTDWSTEHRSKPERKLRFVLGLARGSGGLSALTVEARLTSRKLVDQPRRLPQLQQLLREAERTPGTLTPEQYELLEVFLDSLTGWSSGERGDKVSTTTIRRLLEAGAGTPTLVWDEALDPDLASLGGIVPGDPVRLGTRRPSIVPRCEPGDGGLVLDLHLAWQDGRSHRLERAMLMPGTVEGRRHPSLVLCEGELHIVAEQPPAEIIDHFMAAGGLPLERKAHGALIQRMAERFPSMRESLAPYTRVHAAVPMVAIDLRDDHWMQIRLFATTPDSAWKPLDPLGPGARVHEYEPPGVWNGLSSRQRSQTRIGYERAVWAETESAPAAGEEGADSSSREAMDQDLPDSGESAWLEHIDDSAVAPAVEWLAECGANDGTKGMPGGIMASAGDRYVGWWLRMSTRRMASLAAAWSRRPPGVRWYCTPLAKRLLGEARPVRPRVSVKSSGVDWFSVSAEWEAEGLSLTDEDLATLRRSSAPYVKISSGWMRREAGELLEQAAETLADLGIEPGGGEQRLSVWQLAQASPESLSAFEALGIDRKATDAIRRLREAVANFSGLPSVDVPAEFVGTLRPYQRLGVDFLAYTSSIGLGTVLADDMGLGKTIQALAWLLWLRERTPDLGPALVVCPASVVHNWGREAAVFAPRLRVALLTSGGRRRALMREAAEHDLLVTNYALLRRDIETWHTIPLGVAILDEAQNIKNPDAAATRAALMLHARHRLALTGTPLENRALDLWSIMNFVNPGLLGDRADFTSRFDRPDAPAHVRRLLTARLRPVLLRRLKREVAQDLPPRIEERRDCEMHPGQRRLYLAELARGRDLIGAMGADPESLQRHRFEILAVLTRLRQICCHPALTGAPPPVGSGKFDALWEVLEPLLEEGHKVLLFSQFVRCLNLLKSEMVERGIAHHMLTGQTRKREEVVTRFHDDPRPGVFLVSLKAGGTGLNLTAASYVILFDPWWNPAVEAQAIDRTHRIGQTRTVIAYRMLTRGTVEERIWELQQRKAALARDVLGEEGFARALSRVDLEYLLAPEP